MHDLRVADLTWRTVIILAGFLLAAAPLTGQTSSELPYTAVYNQAYQENSEPDSLELILREAENAYILLDPFDDSEITAVNITTLKEKGNQCAAYISIGTGEDWRADFELLQPWLSRKPWGQWEGEYFVSRISPELTAAMKGRLDRIAEMGFDWVEFDNMDWFLDDRNIRKYKLQLSRKEGLDYIEELRRYAAALGLRCMAKNMRVGAEAFDGVTWESYRKGKNWWEPEDLKAFLDEGKPAIIFHYDETDGPAVLREYRDIYGPGISFLWESRREGGYIR